MRLTWSICKIYGSSQSFSIFHEKCFFLSPRKNLWLRTKGRKRRDSSGGKEDVERRKVFGIKYNVSTHIRVGSFVSSRTCEGYVFVTSLVNDETTNWNTSKTCPKFLLKVTPGQIGELMRSVWPSYLDIDILVSQSPCNKQDKLVKRIPHVSKRTI